jgi:hypothetical protein
MALYFYEASKNLSRLAFCQYLNQVIFGEEYVFNSCLQLLYLAPLSKVNPIFKNNIFNTKIVLFQQSSLYQLVG